MKKRALVLLLPVVALLVPSPPPATAAGEGEHRYDEYVALGDSWTADVFTSLPNAEFVPLDCAQSPTDYPHQVARTLGVSTFRDASCGSATSADFTGPQSLPLGGVNPPQFDRLSPTTDLVTVGIGGNDIGLAAAVTSCLNLVPLSILGLPAPLGRPCTSKFTAGGTDVFEQRIAATEPKLVETLRQVHQLSPRADVFLVNYLAALPVDGKGCWPIVPIVDGDMAYLQKTFLALNAMLQRVARADGHTRLVDTYTPTIGHHICTPPGTAYAAGVIPLALDNPLLLAFPAHPTQSGADAQARIVADTILAGS